jgi:membrane protein implicated in regulation of membrane protease activity
MSILTIYLAALGIGGALLVMTLVLGGDGDADADVDADVDVDGVDVDGGADAGHGDADHGAGFDGISAWLPVASGRFWIFCTAGFGLVGTILTAAELASFPITLAVSIGVGYVAGWSMVTVMRRLQGQEVSSSIGEEDYVGAHGRVVLPVVPGRTGKVQLHIGGRRVDLLAVTEDDKEHAIGQRVVVYAVKDDGTVVVTRMEELPG